MSYCRFENTLHDLNDCQNALESMLNGDESKLLHIEKRKAAQLIQTCYDILLLVQDHTGVGIDDFMENMDSDSDKVINKFLDHVQKCAK